MKPNVIALVVLYAIGFLLYFVGMLSQPMLSDYLVTIVAIFTFEGTARLLWSRTGLYDVTPDIIKTDEESKIVPLDYVKFLLGMRL